MINLLPPDIKIDRRYGRRNRRLLGFICTIFLIGVVSTAVMLFNLQFVSSDEKAIRQDIEQRAAEVTRLEQKQTQIDKMATQFTTINRLFDGEVRFSELVPQIGALLPNGTIMNSLSLAGGKDSPLQLNVDLESQDLSAVLQQNLVQSELFEAADILTITSKGPRPENLPLNTRYYGFNATLSASFTGAKKSSTQGGAQP